MNSKSTTKDIRSHNRNLIYNLLFQEPNLSQREIAEKLTLSLPTVIQNLADLKEQNLILETGHYQSTGGRKPRKLSLNPMARVSLGLDITRNHISIVLLNLMGEILDSQRVRLTFEDTPDFYHYIKDMAETLLTKHDIHSQQLLGMGISLPSIIDFDHKTITESQVIPFLPEGTSFYEHISSCFSFPVLLVNDASSSGFAELYFRAETQNIFYLLLNNSVGGAIYINDSPYLGEHNRSAEIGHATLIPNGLPCYCGRRGCVNAYCSAELLSEAAQDKTLEGFFRELESHVPAVEECWEQYLDRLAMAVGNMLMLFDCNIIIGGYVGNYIEPYIDEIRKRIQCSEIYAQNPDLIAPCRLHTESSAVGAALNYVDHFRKTL